MLLQDFELKLMRYVTIIFNTFVCSILVSLKLLQLINHAPVSTL